MVAENRLKVNIRSGWLSYVRTIPDLTINGQLLSIRTLFINVALLLLVQGPPLPSLVGPGPIE